MNNTQIPADLAARAAFWHSLRYAVLGLVFIIPLGLLITQQADSRVPSSNNQTLPTLAPMLKRTMPAVVKIGTVSYREVPNNPFYNDPLFRFFFEGGGQQRQESQGLGSGVIIDAGKGYILTNQHVISGAQEIKVTLSDDREFNARVLGTDQETDLALIQIPAEQLQEVPRADSDQLQVGDYAVAIGNPFGLRHTATLGIISALGRTGIGRGIENYIQTDAPINPGNSGGALVNLNGELVGINTMIFSQTGGNIGIGFAIPINMAYDVMEQLLEFGEVQRGRLGVVTQDITAELAKAFDLPDARGAVVTQIARNSPADTAGLRPGDVIVEADGKNVENSRALRNRIGLSRLGEVLELVVIRDGRRILIKPKLADQPPTEVTGAELHAKLAGANFTLATPAGGRYGSFLGIAVAAVQQNSAAWKAGLRAGDLILEVNQSQVRDINDLRSAIDERDLKLLMLVQRGRRAYYVTIR